MVAKRKGNLRDLVEERLEKRRKRALGLQADHSKALVPPNHQVVVNNIPVDTGEPHVLQLSKATPCKTRHSRERYIGKSLYEE